MRNLRSMLVTASAVGAAAVGGAAIADAASSSSTTSSSSSTAGAPPARPNFPGHGTPSHENAEKPVTGAAATKAQAAAVKSVGSSKAGAVTTDFGGNGYEVTVTKSDGSKFEVHMDKSFTVMRGGPGGRGGPGCAGMAGGPPGGGHGPGTPPNQSTTSSSTTSTT